MLKAAIIFFVLGVLTFTFCMSEEDEQMANKGRVLLSILLLFSMASLLVGVFMSSLSL